MLEVLLVSVGAGLLGTWIVLRGLAFYTHAVAAAAFPGLVLAAGLGFAPMAGRDRAPARWSRPASAALSARRRAHYDVLTALALVGALVVGVVLASERVPLRLGGGLAAVRQPVRARRISISCCGAVASVLALVATRGARAALAGDRLRCQSAARALGARSRCPTWRCSRSSPSLGGDARRRRCAAGHRAARRAGRDGAAVDEPAAALAARERRARGGDGLAGVWLSVRTNAPPGRDGRGARRVARFCSPS